MSLVLCDITKKMSHAWGRISRSQTPCTCLKLGTCLRLLGVGDRNHDWLQCSCIQTTVLLPAISIKIVSQNSWIRPRCLSTGDMGSGHMVLDYIYLSPIYINPCHVEFISRNTNIWARSPRCICLVTWVCCHMIAKLGNKTDPPSWPDPYICIFYHFTTLEWCRYLKPFLMEGKTPFVFHGQYHGCWWPGDVRSQDIINHGIDLVYMEYSILCTREDYFWHPVISFEPKQLMWKLTHCGLVTSYADKDLGQHWLR